MPRGAGRGSATGAGSGGDAFGGIWKFPKSWGYPHKSSESLDHFSTQDLWP